MFSIKELEKQAAELNEIIESELTIEKIAVKKELEASKLIDEVKPKTIDEAMRIIERLINIENRILELEPNERKIIEERLKEATIVNPSFIAGPLGPYYCQFNVVKWAVNPWNNGNTSGIHSSCSTSQPGSGVNEINAKLISIGTPNQSNAFLSVTADFHFPAYPSNAKILVETCIDFNGSYLEIPSPPSNPHVDLVVDIRGYQNGNIMSQTHTANLLTNHPGLTLWSQYNIQNRISMIMDVAPEPFWVVVRFRLNARATGSGCLAVIDFESGDHCIKIPWVNTQPLRI